MYKKGNPTSKLSSSAIFNSAIDSLHAREYFHLSTFEWAEIFVVSYRLTSMKRNVHKPLHKPPAIDVEAWLIDFQLYWSDWEIHKMGLRNIQLKNRLFDHLYGPYSSHLTLCKFRVPTEIRGITFIAS